MDVKALKAGVSVLAVAATIVGSAAALSQEPKQVDLAYHSFPPHLIDDPKGEKQGFDVDILKCAFEISGWQTAVTFFPWRRAKQMAENGEVDGLCACAYDKGREKNFLFTEEYGAIPVGVYYRNGDASEVPSSIEEFPGKSVAVVSGYMLHNKLKRAGFEPIETNNDLTAVRMLLASRFDYYYGIQTVTDYFAKQMGGRQKISFREFESFPYYICLSRKAKNTEKLRNAFNSGIRELIRTGEFEKFRRDRQRTQQHERQVVH